MLKKAANSITGINIISALFLQLVTIISGFIIPRVMLSTFGSEVNGLVSSITQFLNYISLLEGGVGAVIATSLYLPLNKRDNNKLSAIIKSSHLFFKKTGENFFGIFFCPGVFISCYSTRTIQFYFYFYFNDHSQRFIIYSV